MTLQPDLAPIPVGEFSRQVHSALIPINNRFSYFIAGLSFTEEDIREYLEEPTAAIPPGIVERLPQVTVLLVPFLMRPNGKGKTNGDGNNLVCFDRPLEAKALWSSSIGAETEQILAFAVKDQEVADYHYYFYRQIAAAFTRHLSFEEMQQYLAILREELNSGVNGEVDEESWRMKQALLRRQKTVRRETKPFLEYGREYFVDTMTLYLHGLCCDIDVEMGPRQLPSRHLRRRLMLLRQMFPPPQGYAVFPEDLDEEDEHKPVPRT